MADQILPFTRAPDLPVFERPPVTDVALGVQFEGVGLRAVDLGLLRQRFEDQYPLVEEQPPLPLQIEVFSQKPRAIVELQLVDRPPLPMVVFLSRDRSRLVQVQSNRFACAWRRTETTPYPKYKELRDEFVRNATIFNQFLNEVGLTHIGATQAEVAYVNDIPIADKLRPDVLFHKVVIPDKGGAGYPVISGVSTFQQFMLANHEGIDYARLHIASEPTMIDGESVLRISLLYRGEPYERDGADPGLGSIVRFLDEGHEQIVRAFVANTTDAAHQSWRRRR